jgi:hypothetical protein
VGAENPAGTFYTEHDWQCDINAAHPAAMLTLTEVPAFGHFDEVEVYDEHPIEAHTMYIIDLQSTDINAAHPAAMLTLTEVPAFGHFDEVEVYDEHPIEAHTMYIIDLQSTDRVDPFLNADVTPVLGRNYLKYLQLVGARAVPHVVTHFVRPSRIIRRCHVPQVVQATLTSSCDALQSISDVADTVFASSKRVCL